jgi:Tfp pilus assembly protein PilO
MRSTERMILVGVAVVALAVGFYLFVLGPKRDKAGELKDQVNTLNGSITAAEQQVTYGEQARQDFAKYYGRMVVLGKAVPGQSDTASLLVQLSSIAHQSKTDLRAIGLNQGSGSGSSGSAAPAPSASSPPAAASTASTASSTASTGSTATGGSTTATSSTGASSTAAPAATTAAPAPATEASAAALPIGSVVGPAGLPTLPYSVTMTGNYFYVASFIGKVDDLVEPVASGTQLSPDGRLLTINGFGLQVGGSGPSPTLKANLVVTAYSTGDQGLTLGASPSGPAPASPGETQVQPTSAVVAK